ncbi:SseB family protein [Galactobacillus timonensis]|uniref:SseB family protein n=1 Tax=Galactobacillus timonensis TaxID=2041840 RepID=UPI000C851128|nr:SseB family protein [Galactobacillus timonensis]
MSENSIVHEQLKEAAAAFLKDGGQVQYRLLQEEVFRLIQRNAPVLINGIPLPKEDQVDPMGVTGPDGLFYAIIFTSLDDLEASKQDENPSAVYIRDLIKSMFLNQKCGGIAINYVPNERTPLIAKQVLLKLFDESLRQEKAEQDSGRQDTKK